MITEVLLLLYRGIIGLITTLLPSPNDLPSNITGALNNFFSYFEMINKVFPVDTVFQVFAFMLSFEAGILLFKFVNFALNKLRGSG